MKKGLSLKAISSVLALVLCFSLFSGTMTSLANDGKTVKISCSVADFGADGSDTEDDWHAFRNAMAQAIGLSYNEYLRVEIPAGKYYLRVDVPVYSNTIIAADKEAQMISTNSAIGHMLVGSHLVDGGTDYGDRCYGGSSCKHGGYTQTKNVTITGGLWDRGAQNTKENTSVFSFRHASDITIKDLTAKNTTDHMINLSGTRNVLIKNITLQNQISYTGTDKSFWGHYEPGDANRYNTIEAIHLDYCNKEGEDSKYAYPYDNTPAFNVTVTGCTFENIYACVGTHHTIDNKHRASKITVTDNTMKKIRSFCIYAYCFDNVLISGNTVTEAGSFATLHNSKVTLKNNKVKTVTNKVVSDTVYAFDSTSLVATGNTLSDAGRCGITLEKNSNATAENNSILNSKTSAFRVVNGSVLKAKKNTLKNAGLHALYIESGAKAEFISNRVDVTQKSALRAAKKSSLTAKDNKVNKAGESAIHCTDSSKLVATGNTLTNAVSCGIAVKTGSAATIKNNTISKPGGKGIHVLEATDCLIENNKVTSAKDHGILVEGTKSNPGSATIKNNTLASTGGKDLRLGKYALKCVIGPNTLKNKTFSVDKTATYTRVFATPKLTGISNAKAGITVKWKKSSGAAKYRVLRKSGSGSFKKVADVSNKTNSYTDKTAKSGTKYTYTVRCISADGKKNTSGYDKTGKTLLHLSVPTLKNAKPGAKKITVTWGKVTGAKGYYVYRKTGSGKWSKVASVPGTSYTDKSVVKGKKYTYTVYAYNGKTKSSADLSGIAAKAK